MSYLLVHNLFSIFGKFKKTYHFFPDSKNSFQATHLLYYVNIITESVVYLYKNSGNNSVLIFCRSGLAPKIRQLTDGYHMIQLIYDAQDQLADCEFSHDENQTKLFLKNLEQEMNNLGSTSNLSVQPIDGISVPHKLHWINYNYLRKICEQKHKEIKNGIHRNGEKTKSAR